MAPVRLLADQQSERHHRHHMRRHQQRMQQAAGEAGDAEQRGWASAGSAMHVSAAATRRLRRHSCEPAEKHQPGDGDRAAGRAHRDPSRGPARQQAEGDAGRDAASRWR